MARNTIERPFEMKKLDTKTGTFTGYGSVFGELDSYRDIVVKGAFSASIADYQTRGVPVPMLWQHRSMEPIGIYTKLEEDDHGLYLEGEINMDVQRGRECLSLMKQKAMSGLSIGYDTVDFEDDGKRMVRFLKQVALWEISPVTFPAGQSARVIEAKMYAELDTLRKCEEALQNMWGLSKSEATAMISRIKAVSGTPGEPDVLPTQLTSEVKNELRDVLSLLRS